MLFSCWVLDKKIKRKKIGTSLWSPFAEGKHPWKVQMSWLQKKNQISTTDLKGTSRAPNQKLTQGWISWPVWNAEVRGKALLSWKELIVGPNSQVPFAWNLIVKGLILTKKNVRLLGRVQKYLKRRYPAYLTIFRQIFYTLNPMVVFTPSPAWLRQKILQLTGHRGPITTGWETFCNGFHFQRETWTLSRLQPVSQEIRSTRNNKQSQRSTWP